MVLVLPVAGGCSLLDALQGGGGAPVDPCLVNPGLPECLGFQFTCEEPLRLDAGFGSAIGADMCGQNASEPPDACGVGPAADAVFELKVTVPGDYILCTSAPGDSTFALSRDCRASGGELCLFTNDCIVEFLTEGSHFIRWRAGPFEPCDFVELFVDPFDGQLEEGSLCLDGRDNDSNGLTDCEDVAGCRFGNICGSGLPGEACNGVDDGDVFGAGFDMVDEGACLCVDDSGCDHIDLDSPLPFVCHTKFNPNGDGAGVCAPPCDPTFNWCEEFGGFCSGGRCEF